MADSPDRHESLTEILNDLSRAANIPSKQRPVKITATVEALCSAAYQDGLSDESLDELVDLITLPNELDQASRGRLVKTLFPTSKVRDEVAIKIVGCLGHGRVKPPYSTQAALLKWLVMVHDVLENPAILSRLYGILFNLLDTVAIRPQLCHLLALITRRKHIRPFRIQSLMELTRQAGHEPPLVGLMRVYKDYYPDVIVSDVVSGRASVFTHPDLEWRQRLGEIQESFRQKLHENVVHEKQAFRVTRKSINTKKGAKTVVPEVFTSHAHESSTTLEEIDNVTVFVNKLEKIQLPNQMVAVIGDPLLQRFLQLRSSETILRRIDNWLLAFFEDQLDGFASAEENILDMLAAIRDYTDFVKQLPPACLIYLRSMLPSWNGVVGRQVVLDLLSFTPVRPFEELFDNTFRPLEEALLENDTIESKIDLLKFYSAVIRQWSVSLLSQPQDSTEDGEPLSDLIQHTGILALTILQNSLNSSSCSSVLDFYDEVASIISHPDLRKLVRIITPPAETIYTLYFTSSLSTLSRLCSILCQYKRAFELVMLAKVSNPGDTELPVYPKEYVNAFNGFLMDICNCIWRSRAFNSADTNALGCLIPAPIIAVLSGYTSKLDTTLSLPSLFSLSYSPLFCLATISYVRELEDAAAEDIDLRHAGPVTQASLKQLERDGGVNLSWAEYRMGALRSLEERGAPGVNDLMCHTMKNLMTARQNMEKAKAAEAAALATSN